MMYHANNTITGKAKAVFSRVLLGAVIFAASLGSASAAFITGDMGLTGAFTPNDTLDNATLITLTSATGTSGTGDLGATVGFGTPGAIGNGAINLDPFSPITDLLSIGGWQLDLSSMTIVDQTASVLNLSGNGLLTGNGFDATAATWVFSSNSLGTSYSMTITSAVPVPAAVWLFGSGLLGLIGIARKKA